MEAISTHKDLIVWQKAVELATKVYAASRSVPSDDRDALLHQLRRTSVAVASSIAEGAACRRRGEFLKFLESARRSLVELETHMLIAAQEVLLPDAAELLLRIAELQRLLNTLMRRLADTARQAHARACALETGTHLRRSSSEPPLQ